MDWIRPWENLPEGIVELIINKLHFPDQICAVAVCKNWRCCKDYVRCSGCLPWVISSQRAFDIYIESDSEAMFEFSDDDAEDFDGDDGAGFDIGDGAFLVGDVIDIESDSVSGSDNDDDGGELDIGEYDALVVGEDNALVVGVSSDNDSDGVLVIGDGSDGENGVQSSVRELFDPVVVVSSDNDSDGVLVIGEGSDGENGVQSSVRELFDPYSRKVSQVSNPIIMDPNGSYIPLAAKNGWVWVLFVCNDSSNVLLHNPFTDEIRSVYPFPKMKIDLLHAAFKGDPTSPDFEIFTLRICDYELHVDIVKRDSYTSDSIVQKLDESHDFIYDALYTNGYIYCLFRDGKLFRYGLEDGSWNLLTSGFPEPYESSYYMLGDWLLEIEGNLIMVRMDVEDETHKWMIFRFDWTKMSWAVENLKSCAIYVSDFLAFSTPLKSSNGEILEGCRLFHNEDRVFKCYSLSEPGGVEMQSEEYSWITRPSRFQLSFIERPYIGI